jgi:cardiolipin synthase
MASRSLLVLPDDSPKAIFDAIAGAQHSIRVKMFVFSDPELIGAIIAARERGISVRVMLNPARRSGEEDNSETRKRLTEAGVDVLDSNPAYALTHEKSMVVDDTMAFINSLNWATRNLTATRDYAVITSHEKEVREIMDCFDADWNRQPFTPSDPRLIWCPGGREAICHFIDNTQHTLFVPNAIRIPS